MNGSQKSISREDSPQSQPLNISESDHSYPLRNQVRAEDENKPRSLIVTLNIKKSIRPQVKAILALPWKNRVDPEASVLDSRSEVKSIQSAIGLEAGEKQGRNEAQRMTRKWQTYRKTILELYKDQNKTLKEVETIMREQYGFVAP